MGGVGGLLANVLVSWILVNKTNIGDSFWQYTKDYQSNNTDFPNPSNTPPLCQDPPPQ